ncbi:LysR family transcriptional regulator, partial [Nitrosomonas sp.]|uniref:LysR family transcriptional regulator n=1 Tax=Nitrosomonas sp. TaxID=42353 RepID=UPI0025F082CC
MELHQIRYFLAVCDHGSFTRAAEFSYVSQPSLTHAIKKLEMELGGELFTRDRSGCQLTPLGHMIQPNLRKIFQDTVATKADAIRFTRLNTVPLRIGIMTTVGAQRLNPCFARYLQDYPNIEFEIIIDNDQSLLEQLESGQLDLAISPTELTLRSAYQTKFLYTERYVVAFA